MARGAKKEWRLILARGGMYCRDLEELIAKPESPSNPTRFAEWFAAQNEGCAPHAWQAALAADSMCRDRLIRVPTGFGKTAGVVQTWLWHRVHRKDAEWPRRLVFCLPMRVLVEQVEACVHDWLRRLGCLWTGTGNHDHHVGVHVLMGGLDSGDWHLHPEADAILIGTQDMLLSRSLNRGYAAARARWPMEFGLLEQDCLWIYDEVQLMDVALATSVQLQTFREQDRSRAIRPCHNWWMSATLQRDWLVSVDSREMVDGLPQLDIPAEQRHGHLWDDVSKSIAIVEAPSAKELTSIAVSAWQEHGRGRLTLIVVNTVDRAINLHRQLAKALKSDLPQDCLHLVHSRFRPHERAAWREQFLRRDAPIPESGRVIVATQVVEAGVDLDAALLITELAPWPSLVQRFGRVARGGGSGQVYVVDFKWADDKKAAPYPMAELAAARSALDSLSDVSPGSLEQFEEHASADVIAQLYPYAPRHLLLRHERDELFDTTPDLTGADLDISRFLRSGDERDVQVFWASVCTGEFPASTQQPSRAALCAVPFLQARTWICDKGSQPKRGMRAWIWDWLNGAWRKLEKNDIVPGRVVFVANECGGYVPERGFDPKCKKPVPVVDLATPSAADEADNGQDQEQLSSHPWKTIACHGGEVADLVAQLAGTIELQPRVVELLRLAARWHDLGKAHPAFQGSISHPERPSRVDLAKAPSAAWPRRSLYRMSETEVRRGFRHELASTLALFSVLQRHRPDHPALLGPHAEVLRVLGDAPVETKSVEEPNAVEQEILALGADEFDLVAYLVASHHGKVRCSLHASPDDQDYRASDDRGLPIRGIREGDELPATELEEGGEALPKSTLTLEPATIGVSCRTGASWTERTARLLAEHGPGRLAFLEALLRAADIRASRLSTPDPALVGQEVES